MHLIPQQNVLPGAWIVELILVLAALEKEEAQRKHGRQAEQDRPQRVAAKKDDALKKFRDGRYRVYLVQDRPLLFELFHAVSLCLQSRLIPHVWYLREDPGTPKLLDGAVSDRRE
jgi:hypothetical protein